MLRIPVLALLLVLSLLAGCSSSGAEDEETTDAAEADAAADVAREPGDAATDGDRRVVEVLYTSPQTFGQSIEQTLAPFNEEGSDIQVRLISAGQGYFDLLTRVQADIATGNRPDLVQVPMNNYRPFVDAGLAATLEPLIEADPDFDLDQFPEAFTDLVTFDGQTYGLPWALSTPVMFYNADAFVEVGLDPDDPPQTWSEVREAAELLTDPAENRFGVHWTGDYYVFQSQLESNGGSMMTDDQTVTLTDEPGVEVLEYWADLYEDGLHSDIGNTEYAAQGEAFSRGDIAMYIQSISLLHSIEMQADFDLRTAPMPIPDDGERHTAVGGNGYLILSEDPEQQEAAFEVLKELVSPEGINTIVRNTSYMPVNLAAAEDPELLGEFLADNPNRAAATDQIPFITPWFNFPGRATVEITQSINEAVLSTWITDTEPAEAMATLDEQILNLIP